MAKVKNFSPNIQKYWMPIHTTNLKSLIVQAPILHLPTPTGCFYLECDSSAKHCNNARCCLQLLKVRTLTMWLEEITPAFSISVEILDFHCPHGP